MKLAVGEQGSSHQRSLQWANMLGWYQEVPSSSSVEATNRLPCQLGWLSAEKEEGLFTFVNLDLSFDFVSETNNYPNHKHLLSLEVTPGRCVVTQQRMLCWTRVRSMHAHKEASTAVWGLRWGEVQRKPLWTQLAWDFNGFAITELTLGHPGSISSLQLYVISELKGSHNPPSFQLASAGRFVLV